MRNDIMINDRIPATIYKAKSEEKTPMVVLCAGGMSSRNEIGDYFVKLSKALNKKGISTITFDVAGNGERVDDEVKTWNQDMMDLMEVLIYLKENEKTLGVDTSDMQLMGYSLGALTAIEFISEHPDVFTHFIAQGPAWTYEEISQLSQETLYNYNFPTEDGGFKEYKISKDVATEMANQLRDDSNIAVNTLNTGNIDYTIVVGENDQDCGIDFLRNNFQNIKIIPESDHVFGMFQDNTEEYCERNMQAFIKTIVEDVEKSVKMKRKRTDFGEME